MDGQLFTMPLSTVTFSPLINSKKLELTSTLSPINSKLLSILQPLTTMFKFVNLSWKVVLTRKPEMSRNVLLSTWLAEKEALSASSFY